jgi:threonylcarbamoyladenosine tRNA methylthiotransferase MtaB
MKKTVAFHTLGCKLNFAETSDLSRKFVENGYEVVDFKSVADVYVINTCTVTALAEKKCRATIRQAIKRNPNAKIAVIGCFSQVSPDEIAKIEGVDFVLGNADKHKLLEQRPHSGS